MNILIKFPSRGRPDKFKETLNHYISKKSNKNKVNFICSFDLDDPLMNNESIHNYLNQYCGFLKYYYGNSNNKIEAINANMDMSSDFDVLMLAADDLYPMIHDYDEMISKDILQYHPDMDGVLHYMNPSWEERLDIGCIMTKKYYDRFGFIYNPTYKSIYCDNEYMEIAKILNRHKYIPTQIFIHDYVISDPTANKNWIFNNEDENNFNHRKQNNFFLT
jgi:hypothetical protein